MRLFLGVDVVCTCGRGLMGGGKLEKGALALYVDVAGLLLAKPVGSNLRVGDLVPHELEADDVGIGVGITRETGPDVVQGAAKGLGGPVRCLVADAAVGRPADERFLLVVKLDPWVRAQERCQPLGPRPLLGEYQPKPWLEPRAARCVQGRV